MNLQTPIAQINRVGKVTASKLAKLEIRTVEDLLFYFPFRYDDFSQTTSIAHLTSQTRANVTGTIELIDSKRSARRRLNIVEAVVSDETGLLKVVWFNQPFLTKNLRVGDSISLSGKVDSDYGQLVMTSPVYEKLVPGQAIHTQGLVPNYHLTATLTQKQLRFLIGQVIKLAPLVEDWLPEQYRHDLQLLTLPQAIAKIHFPHSQTDIEQATQRLAFNELLLLQLQAQMIRANLAVGRAKPLVFQEALTKQLVDSLPFTLTDDQRLAAWTILQDLQKTKPMTRLLEGDVGSGKTIVAVLAMFNMAQNNYQSALMVPTEILAKQHFLSLSKLLAGFDLPIGLFTRSQRLVSGQDKPISKSQMTELIATGHLAMIIGTQSLIQQEVAFQNLNLVIIDEQHRFGVEQRQALAQKASPEQEIMPHLLSMTATPIPRSLALALYDDLDISVIKQMPQNRQKITTQIVAEPDRNAVYDFIRQQVKFGRQVFVICPLIDWSDQLGVKSVKQEYDRLTKAIFPDLKIAMLHGQLKPRDKAQIMEDFASGNYDILVATSVIEVGIDVPNATVMMVEGADRFGLAQLHQYRGRVGRSSYPAFCFLFPENDSQLGNQRLQALIDYDNGFALAKADLKFRGPGEVYGTLQKGFPELRLASLYDFAQMKQAKEVAKDILKQSLDLQKYPKIKEKIGGWDSLTHLE